MLLFYMSLWLTLKKNTITKLQKLYSLPRNLSTENNKLPTLFLKNPLCTGFIVCMQNIHWKACQVSRIMNFTIFLFVFLHLKYNASQETLYLTLSTPFKCRNQFWQKNPKFGKINETKCVPFQFMTVCFNLFYHLMLFCRTIQFFKRKKVKWSQIDVTRNALQNHFFAPKMSSKVLCAIYFYLLILEICTLADLFIVIWYFIETIMICIKNM